MGLFLETANCQDLKFKRLALDWVIRDRNDLPNSPDYIYQPRPPTATNKPKDIPPQVFHLRRWAVWHDCTPLLDTQTSISCIPKTEKSFDTTSNSPADTFAWDLEAKHVISAVYLAFYHVFILVFPFGFWGWWIKTHPNDLRGASIPVAVVLGLLSLVGARTVS